MLEPALAAEPVLFLFFLFFRALYVTTVTLRRYVTLVMADPEWHWADPIVLSFNKHLPSSELTLVNGVGIDSVLMK